MNLTDKVIRVGDLAYQAETNLNYRDAAIADKVLKLFPGVKFDDQRFLIREDYFQDWFREQVEDTFHYGDVPRKLVTVNWVWTAQAVRCADYASVEIGDLTYLYEKS